MTTATAFDVATVRKDFPILHQQVHGHPLVYLDNAASSQKPKSVIDAISQALHFRLFEYPSRRPQSERTLHAPV